MFLRVKNEVCRGWKVPVTPTEAKIFAQEVRRYAKMFETYGDEVYRYEKWRTKGGKVFVLKINSKGGLAEIGWIHSLTGEYEKIW